MNDYSIANTTKEERIALIRQWLPDDDGLDDSEGMDLWDIYADYINGKREIAEINALDPAKDYARFAEIPTLQAELDDCEPRWLELSERA